ncbi:hypothetical protein A2997_01475 [Candidatus Nomurabacteria bacterium RIFCSPLOWO2_01_FULL_36_10b]|uniref:Orotate phosphoribosyltransferase n=1 Tax=Candidatus Nomurabacteria bacterium RIFCSPLOWO2_01_FULL_36_10b TaxID=1801766 RepID=A0A1F6WNC5_9BACT|nr:MAG: hypothetical protein A2997_01475 [Candidatus Nomurabacteria bacterium RIFCSPLOWO2_01_FULL_36_10b]
MENLKQQMINIMLKNGIIKTNFVHPFTLKSGIKSPIYCNLREIMAYPYLLKLVISSFKEQFVNGGLFDVIMGVHSGAAVYADCLAYVLWRPLAYVRPDVKAHGLKKQIEGASVLGKSIFLIEDVISTGGSIINDAEIILKAGATSVSCHSIFSYEMEKAKEEFANASLSYSSLLTIQDVLLELKETGNTGYEILKSWFTDPKNWFKTWFPKV